MKHVKLHIYNILLYLLNFYSMHCKSGCKVMVLY